MTTLSTELFRTLIEQHPIDTALVLERYPYEESWGLLAQLPLETQAEIVEAFHSEYAAELLLALNSEQRFALIRELPSQISSDILEHFSDPLREEVVTALPSLHQEELELLDSFEDDTAGSLMNPEFTALREDATVTDAIRRLRRLSLLGRSPSYIYIENDEGQLTGVLMMRDLVLSQPNLKLRSIMIQNVIRVYTDDSLNDVARLLREKRLLAVPVVNDKEELLGVISGTELVEELQEEGFEDAQKMFGAGSDEHATSAVRFSISKRLPWLEVNLITAFMAAAVVASFDGLIAQITILAAFLPVVAGQSGNAGAQALAVMLRSLAMNEVDPKMPQFVLRKEALVGLVNGVLTGLSAAVVAYFVSKSWALALVVLLAMTVNLVVAGLAGAGIPILMQRLNQDPAQSSNIILTTVTDVLGFATFLGLALLAKPYLLGL
ncbi:MAG: magnesium transporter [Trueperaceae bacterium]|nr:magnesium transporter [Trueperaceae bacterium]